MGADAMLRKGVVLVSIVSDLRLRKLMTLRLRVNRTNSTTMIAT